MFYLPPAALLTSYKGNTGFRALSPRIWSRFAQQMLTPDGSDNGFIVGSDLRMFGKTAAVASNLGRYSDGHCQYLTYEGTGDTIAQIETDRNGAVKILTAATDNNEDWIQPGDTKSVMATIGDAAANAYLCAFECRFKVGQITETGFFIGLSEETMAISGVLATDTGALSSKDFVGFHCPMNASAATCSFVHRMAGQTAVTVISGLKTMVADTYVNMGFVFDPKADTTKRITVYLDNVEQTTYTTGTQIAAATFPDNENFQPLFGLKTGEAVAKSLTIDSWAFGQIG